MGKHSKAGKGILILVCILLIVGLAGFLYWYRQQEKVRVNQLKREAAEAAAEAQSGVGEQVIAAQPGTETVSSASAGGEQEADALREAVTHGYPAVSFRGDGFYTYGEDTAGTDVATLVKRTLGSRGVQIEVTDQTLDMAGTLTQMQDAGVPRADLDAMVSAHRAAAGGTTLQDTETIIRDETAQEIARTDQADFPVIGMGYYGGFMDDPNELIRQQERLLSTYSQQQDFLILGYYPERFSSASQREAYSRAMQDKWGSHYVDLTAIVPAANPTGPAVRQKVAEAIAEKILGA